MKLQNRVYLAAIRRQMQRRLRFPTRELRNEAFDTLWYGWWHKCLRQHGGYANTYRIKYKRGYLEKNEAIDFWIYICEYSNNYCLSEPQNLAVPFFFTTFAPDFKNIVHFGRIIATVHCPEIQTTRKTG